MSLHLGTTTAGEPLTLPLDAATRRMAILAMPGAGKSNAAVVMAEEMTLRSIPWVAIKLVDLAPRYERTRN